MPESQETVVAFMESTLGPLIERLGIPETALTEAADVVESAYGAAYADFTNSLKWKTLAEFYAFNTALTYCTLHYTFTAEGATVEGDDVFKHVQAKWNASLALAQGFLAEAGITGVLPGAPAVHRNHGFRMGAFNTKYLTDREPGVPI